MGIREILKELAKEVGNKAFTTGTVVAIDTAAYSCDVLPSDGSPLLYDVRLRVVINEANADFVLLPTEKSEVVVGFLDNQNAVVVQYSEIDKIISFGGKRGGMLYADKVLPLLEEMQSKLQAIEQILIGSPIPEAGNGSPSALQIALKTALQTAFKQPLNDFENKNFLQ
jgi:hypothetical protein